MASPSNEHPKVLILDDDQGDREFLAALCIERGYESIAAESYEDGGEAGPLVLIILNADIRNGFNVSHKFRKDPLLGKVPLILTSAKASPKILERHKLLPTKADEYVIKPFADGDIEAAIAKFLPIIEPSPKLTQPDEPDRLVDGDQNIELDEGGPELADISDVELDFLEVLESDDEVPDLPMDLPELPDLPDLPDLPSKVTELPEVPVDEVELEVQAVEILPDDGVGPDLQAEIDELRAENERLSQELTAKASADLASNNEVSALEAELNALKAELFAKAELVQALELANKSELSAREELTEAVELANSQVTQAQGEVEKLQGANEQLQATVNDLQASNGQLQATVDELQASNGQLQVAVNELQASNETLLEEVEKSKLDLEQTTSFFERLEAGYKDSIATIEAERTAVEAARNACEERLGAFAAQGIELAAVKEELVTIREAAARADDLAREVERLQVIVADSINLENKLTLLQGENTRLQSQISELDSANQAMSAQISEMFKMKRELAELEAAKKEMELEKLALEAKLTKIRDVILGTAQPEEMEIWEPEAPSGAVLLSSLDGSADDGLADGPLGESSQEPKA